MELRFVDDANAGVGSADGEAGREDAPDVRLGVVHLYRLQVAENRQKYMKIVPKQGHTC